MTGSRRSMRGQLLLNSLTFSEQAALNDDYFHAVVFMESAAGAVDFKLPPRPVGIPEIVRGDAWKKWRNYWAGNFPAVYRHVDSVLKRLAKPTIGIDKETEDDE